MKVPLILPAISSTLRLSSWYDSIRVRLGALIWKKVALGVEADHVRAQQPLHQLVRPGQDAPLLRRGPRNVEEEADGRLGQPLAQHCRHQHQVIVVHPDGGVFVRRAGRSLGEPAVHRQVIVPERVLDVHLLVEVVTERPEHPVGEAVVVVADLALAERQPLDPECRIVRGIGDRPGLLAAALAPGHPAAPALLQHWHEGTGQAAHRGMPAAVLLPADRLTVGNDQEPHRAPRLALELESTEALSEIMSSPCRQ
jgi:hypothetical protein